MIREQVLCMPKVELHVHLEGSIRPATLLQLAERNGVRLPAATVEGLADWFTFTNFEHFVDIYTTAASCIQKPEDLELITREFLIGQAEQNIVYTEATYTAFYILSSSGIPWSEQIDAINRARSWASKELAVELQLILDIVRERSVEDGEVTAQWVMESHGVGVCALGLSGFESKTEPRKHAGAFSAVQARGIPSSTHAGETTGPWSIVACLDDLKADRIGHGVRCLDDPALVERLRESQVPIEVCPSSNVCLAVVPTFTEHPLRRMIDAGLNVSINSDDPPMFNTTLTDEWSRSAEAFGLTVEELAEMNRRAFRAAFLSDAARAELLRAHPALA